jgi:16S rRNA C967 or C1407 C5-methylase (RsmB/RsmF family)
VELGAFLAWLGAGEVPPAVDRWLGEWLREVGLARDPKAQAIVDFLDAAVAWGALAAFAPFRTRGRSAEAALLKYAAVVRRPRDLLELWRKADAAFAERVRAYTIGGDPTGDAAALARVAAESPDAELVDVARLLLAGLPPWHASAVRRREDRSGADWVARWRTAQGTRPPLWLRVAEPRHTAAVRDMLGADGLRVTAQDGAGLAVVGPTPVFRTRAWREGRVEIQDLASQRVGEAVPLGAGQLAWDACAGTGGKTLQLWARLGGRGAIHASDAAPARLAELRKRLGRVDGRNVRSWAWDGRGPCLLPDEAALRGGFDVVLVDAPCSGSGTWRRRPDARLRSVPSAIPRWAAQQRELLGYGAEAVRPGGALVYATCSVWVEEDEEVVAAFLAENPGWTVEREGLVGAPDLDADTLFVAVLRR